MSDEKLRSKFRPDVIDPVEEKLITHEGVEMPVDPEIQGFLNEDIRVRVPVKPAEHKANPHGGTSEDVLPRDKGSAQTAGRRSQGRRRCVLLHPPG